MIKLKLDDINDTIQEETQRLNYLNNEIIKPDSDYNFSFDHIPTAIRIRDIIKHHNTTHLNIKKELEKDFQHYLIQLINQ